MAEIVDNRARHRFELSENGALAYADYDLKDGVMIVPHVVADPALTELARRTAAEGHIGLVETYVQLLAEGCLDIAGVQRVRVRVEKPEALQGAEAGGVEMVLSRA